MKGLFLLALQHIARSGHERWKCYGSQLYMPLFKVTSYIDSPKDLELVSVNIGMKIPITVYALLSTKFKSGLPARVVQLFLLTSAIYKLRYYCCGRF